MAGLILGRAYEPGIGSCLVEQFRKDLFFLIPERDPDHKILRHRDRIHWRKPGRKDNA